MLPCSSASVVLASLLLASSLVLGSTAGLSKQDCADSGFSGTAVCSDCDVLAAALGAPPEAGDKVGDQVRAVLSDCRSCCIDDAQGDAASDLRRLQNAFVKAVLYVDQDMMSSSRWGGVDHFVKTLASQFPQLIIKNKKMSAPELRLYLQRTKNTAASTLITEYDQKYLLLF